MFKLNKKITYIKNSVLPKQSCSKILIASIKLQTFFASQKLLFYFRDDEACSARFLNATFYIS